MTDREKLIELLVDVPVNYELCMRIMGHCPTIETPCYECLADYLLANGVTFAKDIDVPSKWISVGDEKPKRRGEYFVAYKFMGSDMQFFGSAFWHDDCSDNGYVKGDHFSNEGVDGMYVTHWMYIPKLPMPDPPKEDKHE